MPKKKLTKKQIISKLKTANRVMGDLLMDRTYHADSKVPMTTTKLNEMITLINRLTLKVMRSK